MEVARSAYLEQVRRIAPPDPPGLRDRDAEMAELARFCLDPGGFPYMWWRAGPWAGKSALLSTFVLRPPAEVRERVRLVSFFITARLAAQDTRDAFTEVLLEQLAALLGQVLPPLLPEATREAYLLGLLSQAAGTCAEAGGRLVLVVDGLDEDRGVSTGPDAHSIAGLLPASPAAGMRVIVASRPDPPVPDDVPGWHPLRDPGIIRPLSVSPHARDVQRLGRQELQRLLHGSTAEQDLLGLLAAARGGLSGPDLADLARVPLWEAERILRTVAGRTFQSRPGLTAPGHRPDVYLLGHEELQAAATEYLSGRLAGYRERLHAWAAGYRARGWPAETPEYLFGGYFRLLDDRGDLPRMIECARDTARHDCMLNLTGGDATALAETRTTLDRIAVHDEPDLASALALACHRDHLANRGGHIPAGLPAVWAALGQLSRAEALACSITSPHSRALALAAVSGAVARAGQHEQAAAIAAQAEAVARSITHPYPQKEALAQVANALAQAGQDQKAEAVARSITAPGSRAIALAQVAEALAQAGQDQRAEAVARSITDPGSRAIALAQVAGALAQAGRHQQAAAIAARAEAVAGSITDPGSRAIALAQVAGALAQAGRHQQAAAIAARAEAVAVDHRSWFPGHRPGPGRGSAGPGRAASAGRRHRRAGGGRGRRSPTCGPARTPWLGSQEGWRRLVSISRPRLWPARSPILVPGPSPWPRSQGRWRGRWRELGITRGPRLWPARSPILVPGPSPWPRSQGRWPAPGSISGPPPSPRRPRPRPAQSPARGPRTRGPRSRRRWPGPGRTSGPRLWPARSPIRVPRRSP